jgi:UDP-2,4-diacetamido-2,4,6-trideoxy-beta-L-altropyranose hydrolase
MSSQTLLIRADANVEIGTGHVMRCLALAQAWQDRGGDVVFAMAESSAGIDERLQLEQAQISKLDVVPGSADDADQTARLARELQADWAVVDGYHFDSAYPRFLKDEGLKLLVIDDYGHAGHYSADVVVNQNISAKESLYASREKYTRLCLGLDYVLLRREFKAWREWKREIAPVAKKILVTMGGSDPENLTQRVVGSLSSTDLKDLEAIVVIGSGNPHQRSLERRASQISCGVRLVQHAFDMPELMAWADLAIVAAGGTLWELLFMGCPTLSFARNPTQDQVLRELSKQSVVKFAGDSRNLSQASLEAAIAEIASSSTCRTQMSALGREKLNGLGAERVCELTIELPAL